MSQEPGITLSHNTVCPLTGAEETLRIGVTVQNDSPEFRLLTMDGWITCPIEIEDELRSDTDLLESIRGRLARDMSEDMCPGF